MKIIRNAPSERMSQSVVHNGTVYLSGVTAADAGTDIKSQTRAVLAEIDKRLAAAGSDKSKLLTAMIWLRDIDSDFAPMNEVWADWTDADNKPARATVQAQMARPAILVEIQVTAAE